MRYPRRLLTSKLNVELLNESDDPLVKQVLHGKPKIDLTPDEWVTP